MMSLSADKDSEIIETFNSTSRYLYDLLNIDNTYFDGMGKQIYQSELQLNEANSSDTEAPFLDLHLTISDGFVSSKIYDKRDDFDFDLVNFPFLDGDILTLHLTEFIYHSLFELPGCLVMSLTSTLEIKFIVLLVAWLCGHS